MASYAPATTRKRTRAQGMLTPAVALNAAAAAQPAAAAKATLDGFSVDASCHDMTVQQFLEFKVKQAATAYQEQVGRAVKRMRQRYEEDASTLLAALKDKQGQRKKDSADKKAAKAKSKSAASSSTTTQSAPTKKQAFIRLIGKAGMYAAHTFDLELKNRRICRVGRSTGKTFTTNGVSLSNDSEVSTTHGKFSLKGGIVHFTDVKSTNGSKLNGEDLRPNKATPIAAGDELEVGSTVFVIHFPPAAGDMEVIDENSVAAVDS